jgi:hypothetical protein
VLLNEQNEAFLDDFGIVKLFASEQAVPATTLTTQGQILGTPQYMDQTAIGHLRKRRDTAILGTY